MSIRREWVKPRSIPTMECHASVTETRVVFVHDDESHGGWSPARLAQKRASAHPCVGTRLHVSSAFWEMTPDVLSSGYPWSVGAASDLLFFYGLLEFLYNKDTIFCKLKMLFKKIIRRDSF